MLAQGLRVSSGNFAMFSDAPRLVAGEELRRRAAVRLLLAIDVSERLPVGVADDEAGEKALRGCGVACRRVENSLERQYWAW